MQLTIEATRNVVSALLLILSIITTTISVQMKETKKEWWSVLCDMFMMLIGSLLTLGTFGTIFQLLVIRVKSFFHYYDLLCLSDAVFRSYRKPFLVLTWISIVGQWLAFIMELTKLFK